jgi:hypothetical protein
MTRRFAFFSILLACNLAVAAKLQAQVSEDDVFALRGMVQAGDRGAMRKLLSLETDGAAAEDVSVIMGGAIRNQPDAFLEEVAKTSRSRCDACLDSLLGNLGDDFVDKFRDQVEELSKRRQALRSVKATALRPLRDKCIRLLDKQITQIQSLISEGAAMTPNKTLERTRAR